MTKRDDVLRRLRECSPEERLEIFKHLRTEIPIHALEAKLNTPAELILEAMDRGSDLTMRGIRGIIAEAAFIPNVLEKLQGWTVVEIVGDAAYDFLLEDGSGRVSIQVKMQRSERGLPKVRKSKFVAEVQANARRCRRRDRPANAAVSVRRIRHSCSVNAADNQRLEQLPLHGRPMALAKARVSRTHRDNATRLGTPERRLDR